MKQVSGSQQTKNQLLYKIKSKLVPRCHFCGNFGNDLMHILPKSIYPEYYVEDWNLIIGCTKCHKRFDDDINFRAQQFDLKKIVEKYDPKAAFRHFNK